MLLSRHQATQNKIVKYKYYDKKKCCQVFLFVCLSVLFFSLKVQGFQGSTNTFLASAGWKKGANAQVLALTGLPTMYTLLRQPRLN